MQTAAHTAVVTGAGSKRGIGRATAHALAATGWHVAVLDLDEAGAKDVADEITEQHGAAAVGVACDVTDEASVEAALAVVDGALPPVGALEGDRKEQLLAGTPVGRIGTVADVADLITYLCRPESGYITGVTYDVNGGSHIH